MIGSAHRLDDRLAGTNDCLVFMCEILGLCVILIDATVVEKLQINFWQLVLELMCDLVFNCYQ